MIAFVPSVAAASGVLPTDATAAQRKQATDHFNAARRAVEAKKWEKAMLELQASLDVVDSPNARLVLARALRDSGSLGSAWAEYGRVIESATKLAVLQVRYAQTAEAATTERAELEGKLAFVLVAVAHAPPDATLMVAGHPIPASDWKAPTVVPEGAVDVVLSDAAGKELARQTVSASVGHKTTVTLDAQPPPPPAASKPAPDTDDVDREAELHNSAISPSPPPSDSKLRPYAYVAGGVGVAGLATFTIFGLMDKSTYGDLQNACPHNACPPGKQPEIDSGRTQQDVANVGLVVGAVGLVTGATLLLLSPGKPSAGNQTGLVVGPGYVGLRGSL